MKKALLVSIFGFWLFAMVPGKVSAQVDPNLNTRLEQSPIIVDHNNLYLFDQIPDFTFNPDGSINDADEDCVDDITDETSYFCRAGKIPMIFGNRSVGGNTDGALNCMTFESDEVCWDVRPACTGNCTKITKYDPSYNSPPESVDWFRPGGYDRSNWMRVDFAATSKDMTNDYVNLLINNQVQGNLSIDQFDVYSFQFSYLNVDASDSIADQPGGFFYDNPPEPPHWEYTDVYDLEAQITRFPNKYFIYQTASLARAIGTQVSEDFNNQMRDFITLPDSRGQYRIFFDFADIEAYDPWGNPCYDNRDGVEYCQSETNCENEPDDGVSLAAICPHYATELHGGHLSMGSIKIPIAKAYWLTMAQIAGWDPNDPNPTPPPTPTPLPGDINTDGVVNILDYTLLSNAFGTTDAGADINSDGIVNILDYTILSNNFGETV